MFGDRIIGTKRTILLGAITLAAGYLLLSLPFLRTQYLELPLAIIAVGNGLFKANPSSLLSKIYRKTKAHEDSGFTLYYMAINIGGFLSFLLAPLLSKYFGWRTGFLSCFFGLVLAIFNYFVMARLIDEFGSPPDFKPIQWRQYFLVVLSAMVLIGVSYWLLDHKAITAWLLIMGAIVILLVFSWEILQAGQHEKKGMILFVLLFFQAIVFFCDVFSNAHFY